MHLLLRRTNANTRWRFLPTFGSGKRMGADSRNLFTKSFLVKGTYLCISLVQWYFDRYCGAIFFSLPFSLSTSLGSSRNNVQENTHTHIPIHNACVQSANNGWRYEKNNRKYTHLVFFSGMNFTCFPLFRETETTNNLQTFQAHYQAPTFGERFAKDLSRVKFLCLEKSGWRKM